MDSAFVLASDPRVEPPVDNEQEKIEQLKEVVSRIQDRNCEHHRPDLNVSDWILIDWGR
jgi:O-phosphoseryl-tRNA(Cys) synthetase